jgi:hypothetical protein
VNTATPHPVWRMCGCEYHGSPDGRMKNPISQQAAEGWTH